MKNISIKFGSVKSFTLLCGMENTLKRHREEQDIKLSKAYSILSDAGFDIQIEDGMMSVWYRGCSIEMDFEEGMVIVPNEHLEEFEERQEQLY